MADDPAYDYVVVGSGAGGGTVAARLAEAGMRVFLIEAGGDPRVLHGGDPLYPAENRLPDDYDVPAFHAFATENEALAWKFFVRHYADDARQKADPKYLAEYQGQPVDGVFYPRAGALGGCTTHNALVTVYPHNDDWDRIAALTGDHSWRASNMRRYFERIEDCRYRWLDRQLQRLHFNPSRHGWKGWLQVETAIPRSALGDVDMQRVLKRSALRAFAEAGDPIDQLRWLGEGLADPNDWRLVSENAVGLRIMPLATAHHARNGIGYRLRKLAQKREGKLTIELGALACRVILDGANRATGVEYLKGERLYRASIPAAMGPGETRRVMAAREVILAGGAFNTPQLLMLSGVGPAAELGRLGIPLRVDLPGVGRNLQDRYEIGVVNEMSFPEWSMLKGAAYAKGDPQYAEWKRGRGVYSTNGAVLAVIRRSLPERPLPDLFCFAILGDFRGYYPGYSKAFAERRNYLTWVVLKAHTENRTGVVSLRSADPRDVPDINFHYFSEGSDGRRRDLASIVAGIKFVRRMTAELKKEGLIAQEALPGDDVVGEPDLERFVTQNAW
ncbi:MAG TPA: GMC family oxidoreductase, partial [Verrucomicrobiae bacterium]|nr:GMC family oxidoreductase [Verrucomicrobiae bacterium]